MRLSVVSLRPATNADKAFVERIYFETQRYIIEALFGWRGDETERAKFAEFYDMSNTTIIAECGEDIGWMTVARRPEHIEVEHLYLDEARQGQGIGGALLRNLIEEAEVAHLPLRLATAKMNRARRLYERLGFLAVGTDEFKIYMERRNNLNSKGPATEADADVLP